MVNILEFRRRDEFAPRPVAEGQMGGLPRGHSAEIVIFPGVRIERQPRDSGDGDFPATTAKGPKRRVRRNP